MADDTAVFRVNSRNYIGLEHQNYLAKLHAVKINNVLLYCQWRANACELLQSRLLDLIYEVTYSACTSGRCNGISLFGDLKPSIPDHLASQLALQIGKTVCDIMLTKVINRIIPANDNPGLYINSGIDGSEIEPDDAETSYV
jgi:hypothetical protein